MAEDIPKRETAPVGSEMVPSRALAWAALCSFSVYLIPILGPHAAFLLGETIWQQFRPPMKNVAWALTNLGAGLLFQAAAFALFYWFFRRRTALRLIALLAGALIAVVQAQYLYMVAIPARFLIERSPTQEIGSWLEVCTAADAHLATFRAPVRQPEDGWAEAWVGNSQGRYATLRMPSCQTRPAALPQPKVQPGGRVDLMIGITQTIPGGLAVVQRQETGSAKLTWLLLKEDGTTLNPLPTPESKKYVAPFLSRDGLRTAWILETPDSQPPVRYRVHLLPVEGNAAPKIVDLSTLGPNTFEVEDVDSRTGELLLFAHQPQPHLLGLAADGQARPAPSLPAGVRPQSHTLLLSPHGVVAWDAYKEDENYVIAWSLEAGSGFYKVPRGSSITAVAVDPSGRYVAVSTSTTLNIGNVGDVVFVLRTTDGQEVLRRALPMYNRSGVVFLGREYFAYSNMGTTHVLKLPAD